MSSRNQRFLLPRIIHSGLLNFPTAPDSKTLLEKLLEEDRETHHCRWGPGYHNHLSHHLLAAFDLGAGPKLLKTIYDVEAKEMVPIDTVDRESGCVERQDQIITRENWTNFLGIDKYYASYVKFFDAEIYMHSVGETLERFLFAEEANAGGIHMLYRFSSGAFHPLIQVGYGVEFGSDAMVAQGLAQAAIHELYEPDVLRIFSPAPASHSGPLPLLEILRRVYDSPILKPVMPYNPDTLLSVRRREAGTDGRPEEISKIAALWWSQDQQSDPDVDKELENKIEEMFWFSTLLLIGPNKDGRKPRLDFFLMHILTATLLLYSLLTAIPTRESKQLLLKTLLPEILLYLEMRGRPRIDIAVVLGYPPVPHPPIQGKLAVTADALEPDEESPWPQIVTEVLHAPDAHTVKAIRSLYYAAQKYGSRHAGEIPGTFRPGGDEETHVGITKLDGTLFVRAAGVVMATMGWVRHGQREGSWDRSALGWDDAWKDGK